MSDNMVVEINKSKQKILLAKLLATENIMVEFRNIPTAKFDLNQRILMLPNLKSTASENIFLLYIGHEVGHALKTPPKEWSEAFEIQPRIPRSIINIVEDSRIDKLIKEEYPGLCPYFFKGYKELFSELGIDKQKLEYVNSLSFMDRYNLYFKLGKSFGIEFSSEERIFIEKGELLRSWDDCLSLIKEIADFIKKEPKEPKKKISENSEINYSLNDSLDDFSDGDVKTKEDISITEKELEEIKQKYIDILNEEIINVYAHEPNWKSHVRTYLDVLKFYSKEKYRPIYLSDYLRFSKPYVSYMAQQFNLFKNAKEFKQIAFNRSGELDLDRIHEYRLTNDIFVRKTIRPEGKSHGLVIFLDWSSSMKRNITSSLYKCFFLTDFCRLINIPFEVYTFTYNIENIMGSPQKKFLNGDLEATNYILTNILSNKMTKKEYGTIQQILLKEGIKKLKPPSAKEIFSMGSTPLCQTIIAAMEIVPEFKQTYRLDNVNICFITDGDGQPIVNYHNAYDNSWLTYLSSNHVYIYDRKTYYVEKYESGKLIINLLNLLYNRVQTNIIGFFLANKDNHPEFEKRFSEYKDTLKKNGVVSLENVEGYTQFHIIDSDIMQEEKFSSIDRRIKFMLTQFIKTIIKEI